MSFVDQTFSRYFTAGNVNGDSFLFFSSDAGKSPQQASREARTAFIYDRLIPGVYFTFLTACGLLGGFGFAAGRTRKRETTTKLARQANATQLFDDGQRLAARALRRASFYSLTGVLSFWAVLWLLGGRPTTFKEFRQWTGSWLPSIKAKKSEGEEEGRNDFKSLTELMQYLSDEDEKLKEKKRQGSTSVNDV